MINLDSINKLGIKLNRPECVLTTSNGRIYTADWRGGIGIIEADGSQWYLLAEFDEINLKPNGICLMPDGSFLIAHLGSDDGGVYRIDEKGKTEPYCLEVDGKPLPPTNYVHLDQLGRVWITVSTRQIPRSKAYNPSTADGFIVLVDQGRARIVADKLAYTNECLVAPNGQYLYVNETFGRKLIKYEIASYGDLSNKTTVAHFGPGTFPDGLTFDTKGGIWVTSIVSNRVIRIEKDGSQTVMVEDADEKHLSDVEFAFEAAQMGRPHLDFSYSKKLQNISSLAFGGKDLNTAYLGCLLDESIYSFKAPFAGHPPTHWEFSGPIRTTQELQK